MDPIRSFDELSVGQEFAFEPLVMPLEEMLDFARRFDPQPFHLDPARAAAGPFGGIIASGMHTLAAAFGHMLRTGIMEQVSMGGAGMELRWPNPVRPGDEIALLARVLLIEVEATTEGSGRQLAAGSCSSRFKKPDYLLL